VRAGLVGLELGQIVKYVLRFATETIEESCDPGVRGTVSGRGEAIDLSSQLVEAFRSISLHLPTDWTREYLRRLMSS
jgi:hypothetical protein